jgi:hypothetical protein
MSPYDTPSKEMSLGMISMSPPKPLSRADKHSPFLRTGNPFLQHWKSPPPALEINHSSTLIFLGGNKNISRNKKTDSSVREEGVSSRN